VAGRQKVEEPAKPRDIGGKARRQLEQDRAGLDAKGFDPGQERRQLVLESSNRCSCVMARHALMAKTKPGGVTADQRSIIAAVAAGRSWR
jgi:hypothetical protein